MTNGSKFQFRGLGLLLAAGAILSLSTSVFGDLIELVNGTKFEGTITEETPEHIVIVIQMGDASAQMKFESGKIRAITKNGKRRVISERSGEKPKVSKPPRKEKEKEPKKDFVVAGWRTNWSGRYPNVKTSLAWSAQRNVIWKTPTPGWGNATPVAAGNKVFFGAEKMVLLCASLKSGSIIWKKELSPNDALSPAERGSYQMPRAHNTNGYSSPTPVTDGKHVYVLYGTGLAACYDLNGKGKWATKVEQPRNAWGHSASPVLVDGTFIVHVLNVIGLDAATGKERWRAPSRPHWGSPIPARIGTTNVVITANGEIVRVSDGKILARGLFSFQFSGPVVHDGVVYVLDGANAIALKLPRSAGDTVKPEVLWRASIKNDRYYASPLVHDGVVYGITQHGVLTALDIKDGRKLYERQVTELGRGTVYPSPVLAGKHILISIDSGTTLVIKPGSRFEIVKQNRLEGFRTTPVFAGNRMLVRTLKNLYCIGG